MTSTDHEVHRLWDRIDAWFQDHLHKTPARPAADLGRLRAAEAELAVTLPVDVFAWWTLDRVRADYWIPGAFAPMCWDEALKTREILLLVAEQEGGPSDVNDEPEERFLPSFLPIAMSPGGDNLIVDLRPGDSYGAVFLWDHETWVLGTELWSSVADMLRDVAVALESGTPALLRHASLGGTVEACVAAVDDAGDLDWNAAERQ
ncbi:SMI1/KNR4 family protein [Streptomyces sp. NPDC008238]